MIFLPNFFERYTAALRNTVQVSAIKHGKSKKHFDNMQKIFTAEALYCYEETVPVNIGDYASRLLTSLYILKLENDKHFEFSINTRGNYMMKIKIFTAFLLSVCKDCEKMEIYEYKGKVAMRAKGVDYGKIKKFFKCMKTDNFYERKTGVMGVIFSFSATRKEPMDNYFGNFDITDPFSAINIYFNSTF